jgi:hypothetical protein
VNQYDNYSDAELLSDIAECLSLKGEAEARMEPLKKELLRRQVESGECNIEHDGWQSSLKKEAISAAWIERQYGYPKNELPGDVFDETIELKLNPDKVSNWLADQGFEVKPTYTLAVGRKRSR